MAAELKGNMADVVVVYEQQEYYIQAAVEPKDVINVELLQCQILSLVGLLPEEQILVTSRGEIIASPFANASMALPSPPLSAPGKRERVFVINAATAKDAGQHVPSDWREICSRCTFGDLPVVQPAFRAIGEGDTDALVCAACATTCGTDTVVVSPLDWRSSNKLSARFISELVVVAGDVDAPIPRGFTKVPGDLNFSASGDFVHLFIKRGGTRAVTQVIVSHDQRGEGKAQDSSSTRKLLPVDCNSGSDSNVSVFLSYESVSTSDKESLHTFAITDIALIVGDSIVPEGFIKAPNNINEGCFGSEGIYIGYKLAPLGGFACTATHGAFGECLFQSRHSPRVPAGSVIPAGNSPQSDLVLSSLDNARERADAAFLENHYRQHEPAMRSRLQGGIERVKTYENPLVQAEALKRIPVEALHERARANPTPLPSYRDELVMQLTHWFKREFFTWMNQPKCSMCAFEKTQLVRTDPPSTPEEKAGQAGRVEVYQCPQCMGFTRFPRYNDPVKLLDTRTGRCGEWANCFTLCCRAMGFEARYVLDVTDHVWTEVYSDHFKRWLHCDSCEDQLDRPLTYEVGWGKKLSYIFSFSHEEVVDTARRYTQNWDDMKLRRIDVSESWLASTIQQMNQSLRQTVLPDRIRVLNERAIHEHEELSRERKATAEEVQGRVSGSDEWKSQRQEDRKGADGEVVSPANTVHYPSHDSKTQPPVAELLQTLVKTALIGCGRSSECKNPSCLHSRLLLDPQLSPTDRAARALQEVAAVQSKNFSPHGLASMLCPPAGGIQDFVLSQRPSVYLPLQDSETSSSTNPLVDVSGNCHHAQSNAPLRKPFKIPAADGNVELAFGLQVLPGRQLTVPVPMVDRFTLSWLARFDPPSFEVSCESTALSVELPGGELVRVDSDHSANALIVEVKLNNGTIASSSALVRPGSYYHFSVVVDQTADEIVVFVNAKEAVRAQATSATTSTEQSSTIVFQSPVPTTKSSSAVPVVCHLAVLADVGDESIRAFNEVVKERFVCWPPLQAYDASGSCSDKSCSLSEATVQSGYRVSRIRMWGSEFFDGIQLVYEKSVEGGKPVTVEGPVVGNRVARDAIRSPNVDVALLPNEYLAHLSGCKGAWTDCIRLETSFGRTFTCGGNGGGEFSIDTSSNSHQPVQIRAIQFDVGDHLVDAAVFIADAPVTKDDKSRIELRRIFEKVDSVKQQSAINAVTRYLENIVASPHDPKFQRIRASNKFFSSSVGALESPDQTALMKWCGFNVVVEGGETFYLYQPTTQAEIPQSAWASVRLHYLKAFKSEK